MSMDMTMFTEYIRPELLILVPVLYLIGMGCKKAAAIKDKTIPLLLGAVGILLCLVYLAATCTLGSMQDILRYIFSGITQGVLTAGASVYVNQLFKQAAKNDSD